MVPLPWAPVWCQDVWCGCWHVGSGMHFGRVTTSGTQTSKFSTKSSSRGYFCSHVNVSVCLFCCRYHSLLETQILTSWLRSLRLLGRPQKRHGLSVSVLMFVVILVSTLFTCEDRCIHLCVTYLCREWVVYQTTCPSKYFLAHLWNIYLVQLETTYSSCYRVSSPLTPQRGPQLHR